MKKVKGEYLKQIYTERLTNDQELKECFEFIDKFGVDIFCYEDMHKNHISEEEVSFDDKRKLYYVYYNGKKLFLKKSLDTRRKVADYVDSLINEQLPCSPHCYLNDHFYPSNKDNIFDIGCAEGNLTLQVIEDIEYAYLFECDLDWIDALKATFEPYKDKVFIVPYIVSDIENEETITIDSFCKKRGIGEIDFMKIDVEGYETKVLMGAQKIMQTNGIRKLAACVYHNYEDEDKIKTLLGDKYIIEIPKRYMMWKMKFEVENNTELFTHGIIRATLKTR